MKLGIVVAMSTNRVIGIHNQLPWHLPADLKHFKEITWGKPIIMGRKTYDSIGRPLPGRENIIISRQTNLYIDGCHVVNSLDQALAHVQHQAEAMIIGGSEIFKLALPKADYLYLTLIQQEFEGDTFFPDYNADEWQTLAREEHTANEKNAYSYSFITLGR